MFIRRLNSGMRLQTDPTVIYALGDSYMPPLKKSDLKIDTEGSGTTTEYSGFITKFEDDHYSIDAFKKLLRELFSSSLFTLLIFSSIFDKFFIFGKTLSLRATLSCTIFKVT